MGTSKEYGLAIDLEYEGNHAYSEYCGLLGHSVGLCRKKCEENEKAVAYNRKEKIMDGMGTKPNTMAMTNKWVPKKVEGKITEPLEQNGLGNGVTGIEHDDQTRVRDVQLLKRKNNIEGEPPRPECSNKPTHERNRRSYWR